MKNQIFLWIAPLVLITALIFAESAMAKTYSFERDVEFNLDYKSVAACVFSNQEPLSDLNASASVEAPPTANNIQVTRFTGQSRGRYLNIMLHQLDDDRTRMEYQGTKRLDNETMFADIVKCVDKVASSG